MAHAGTMHLNIALCHSSGMRRSFAIGNSPGRLSRIDFPNAADFLPPVASANFSPVTSVNHMLENKWDSGWGDILARRATATMPFTGGLDVPA
jgi:hypothetical protein